ncbi:MAG: YajQ family cyclic di-GMP-binding protein [Elusimicrobia bacterium]|nr:YajQ family cyclic di-GMP-binding protein [Elusimicrobiota bacterium]
MAQDFSFDVVSRVNLQGVEDAVNMVMKEIANRFDFKGSISRIELNKKDNQLVIFAEDDNRLRTVQDMLATRLVKRGVPLKNFDYKNAEAAENSSVRQTVKIVQGLPSDKAKAVVQMVKGSGRKAIPSIQGEQVRVVSKSKDELQAIIVLLKSGDFGVDLQFENYR